MFGLAANAAIIAGSTIALVYTSGATVIVKSGVVFALLIINSTLGLLILTHEEML